MRESINAPRDTDSVVPPKLPSDIFFVLFRTLIYVFKLLREREMVEWAEVQDLAIDKYF